MKKQEKGITLIALVITIIVMLILTGVTISLLLEEDGIINKAKQARIEQKKAEARDRVELYSVEYYIENSDELTEETKETLVEATADTGVKIDQLTIYNDKKTGGQLALFRMDKTTDEEQEKLEEIGVKPLLGDIDLDGQLTEKDSELILEYDAWMEIRETATPIQIKIADIDGDGEVTANDSGCIDIIINGTYPYEGGYIQ